MRNNQQIGLKILNSNSGNVIPNSQLCVYIYLICIGYFHRGIVNTGNVCFRSAVLQSLLALPPLLKYGVPHITSHDIHME